MPKQICVNRQIADTFPTLSILTQNARKIPQNTDVKQIHPVGSDCIQIVWRRGEGSREKLSSSILAVSR